MEQLEESSQQSVSATNEISSAIEGQVAEVEKVVTNMEMVKDGMNCLSDVLSNKANHNEI